MYLKMCVVKFFSSLFQVISKWATRQGRVYEHIQTHEVNRWRLMFFNTRHDVTADSCGAIRLWKNYSGCLNNFIQCSDQELFWSQSVGQHRLHWWYFLGWAGKDHDTGKLWLTLIFLHDNGPSGLLCVPILNCFFTPICESSGQSHLSSHFTADIDAQAVTRWSEQARNDSQSQGEWKC